MNHAKKIIGLILIIFALSGCQSKETTEVAEQPDNNQNEEIIEDEEATENEEEVFEEEEQVEEETDEFDEEVLPIKNYFDEMIQSVADENLDKFLSYQNEDNTLFTKEQIRWFEEIVYKRNIGQNIELKIKRIELTDSENGLMDLMVIMPLGDQTYYNTGTYAIMKQDDGWIMDEANFEEMKSDQITVLYKPGLQRKAEPILNQSKEIVAFYQQEFSWTPDEEIVIKLYDSQEELLASIPFPFASGWNEAGESIKILNMGTGAGGEERMESILAHEFSHMMLADLTNDNASLYLQEGLATYLEGALDKDGNGQYFLNYDKSKERVEYLVNNEGFQFNTIEEMNNAQYGEGVDLYGAGFILTYYLIETYGMDQFLLMTEDLKKEDYIDQRAEHKYDITAERTTKSLEKIYKSINELTDDYIEFFSNSQ